MWRTAALLIALAPLAAKAQMKSPTPGAREQAISLPQIEAQAYADLDARTQTAATQASVPVAAAASIAPTSSSPPSQTLPEPQMAAANIAANPGPVYTQAPAENAPPSAVPVPVQPAQTVDSQQDTENAAAAESVSMQTGGRCQSVHPGDVVHFALRVEDAEAARAVFSDLHLAQGNPHWFYHEATLPLSDGNVLDGGGVGVRDAADAKLYHFRFIVPEVTPGLYRVQGVWVRAAFSSDSSDPGVAVRLSRRARTEVRTYCLAVFGNGVGDHRMRVTAFQRGPVDPSREQVPLVQLR